MTKANDLVVKHIIKIARKIAKNKPKVIITLDGTSGCGKTSILNRIKELSSDISIIHADYFILQKRTILKYLDDYNREPDILYKKHWYNMKELEKAINAFLKPGRNKYFKYTSKRNPPTKKRTTIEFNTKNPILIIEGCFISHPSVLGDVSDKNIFLKLDGNTTRQRRVSRRKRRGVSNKSTEFSKLFYRSYKDYLEKYKADKKSDLVINMKS